MYGKRTKYKAVKTTVNGIVFDSKKEAKRYYELLKMQDDGLIRNLQRQVKFVLIPAQREPDKTGPKGGLIRGKLLEREVAYIADFVYETDCTDDPKGIVVEDTKGFRTPEYVLKRKMMLWVHGIRITEI